MELAEPIAGRVYSELLLSPLLRKELAEPTAGRVYSEHLLSPLLRKGLAEPTAGRVYSEHLLSPPLRMGLAETALNSLLRYTGGLESRPIEHLFWNTFFKWDC